MTLLKGIATNQESMVPTLQSSSTEGDARHNSPSNRYGSSGDPSSLNQDSNSIFEEEEEEGEVDRLYNKPLLRKNVTGNVAGETVLNMGRASIIILYSVQIFQIVNFIFI